MELRTEKEILTKLDEWIDADMPADVEEQGFMGGVITTLRWILNVEESLKP